MEAMQGGQQEVVQATKAVVRTCAQDMVSKVQHDDNDDDDDDDALCNGQSETARRWQEQTSCSERVATDATTHTRAAAFTHNWLLG